MARPRRPPPEYGPWFEANYGGICCECENPFAAGDSIRHDGYGGYMCCVCGDTGPGMRTITPVNEYRDAL